MQKPVSALRVLIKAILIFVILNLLFAWLNPPIGRLTVYNSLWPGRVRFPYSESPNFYALDYNAPVIQDFDAMFGAHILSAAPKPVDEYRIFLLGDSSTWGGHVSPEDMLAAQINSLGLTSCDGRRVAAYNLGYPWPSLLRDVLFLDYAKRYDPDMVLWLVTLHSFEKKPADREFLLPHVDELNRVIETYGLKLPKAYEMQDVSTTFLDRTIIGQRARLKNLILNQAYGLAWAATGVDNSNGLSKTHPVFPQDTDPNIAYFEFKSEADASTLARSLIYDAVRVGHEVAGDAPLIVVNEPIFIVSGKNSDMRYNHVYPRWAYDAYRQAVAEWMAAQNYPFFDFWDALPAEEFSNDMAHRDPNGEARLANLLAPVIGQFSCP